MNKLFIIGFIFTLLVSCDSKKEENQSEEIIAPNESSEAYKLESEIEKNIAETDLNDKLEIMNSLYFTKEDESSIEVKAFLAKNQEIYKLEEKYNDISENRNGTNIFYIRKGKKYASKERYEDRTGMVAKFIERVTFYDKNEKEITSKIRSAKFEEELDALPYTFIKPYNCSSKRAMDAINQEGEFQLFFQGLIINGRDKYITVGESKANGYVSALMIQYYNSTTDAMLKDQFKCIGKKLDIDYQKITDEHGFEFQLLKSVNFSK